MLYSYYPKYYFPSYHYLYLLILFIHVKDSIPILILLTLLFSLCCPRLGLVLSCSCRYRCRCSFRLFANGVLLILIFLICVIIGIMSLVDAFIVIILVRIPVGYLTEFYFPFPPPLQ